MEGVCVSIAELWNPVREVALAAAILDKRKKGWVKQIKVETLDFMYPRRDVLGQLYGHRDVGMTLFITGGELPSTMWAFEPPWFLPKPWFTYYHWLKCLWEIEIETRCSK